MPAQATARNSDPAQELDALIEEARRRARRRRFAYVAVIVAVLGGIGASLLIGGNGGGTAREGSAQPAEDPAAAVRDAGAQTFSEETLRIVLTVEAPNDVSYEATGLMEPGEGRFRVELNEQPPGGLDVSTVIGLNGEGSEGTVSETRGLFGRGTAQRCWFNPHSPVGTFPGTVSVEESMRVTGSFLESLEGEARSANFTDDGFEVQLSQTASEPRKAFEDHGRRVWGDRELLDRVSGPIALETSADGQVEAFSVPLTDIKPYKFFDNGRFFGGAPRPNPDIATVLIQASLSPSGQELRLDRPNCEAIE